MCLAQLVAAPENCVVRNILAKWYEGKYCVFCGQPVGEAYWTALKPALVRGAAVERCDQILDEELVETLTTAQPVCSVCYIQRSMNRILDVPISS
jgi:hypothetical protein